MPDHLFCNLLFIVSDGPNFATPTNWYEMCNYNMLFKNSPSSTPFPITKNAFITARGCTASESALLDDESTSTTLIPDIPALNTYAATGTGSGAVSYGKFPVTFTINLV